MSKVDRNNPRTAGGSEARYTFYDFQAEFPDDAAVLDWLFHQRWPEGVFCPKCQRVTKHHREKARPSYSCQFCGHRVHPMKGTIFEDSATSLRLWFHGMYLMASTRCGISAKQLERELGVTYKTAWRMFNKIRSLLDQDSDDSMLTGDVEMDGTFVGGRGYWRHGKQPKGLSPFNDPHKKHVFGMVQRKTEGDLGKVYAKIEPNPGRSLRDTVTRKVEKGSRVHTDEWVGFKRGFKDMRDLYSHGMVDHSQNVYVSGDVHTQTIEGFWSLVKRGISGVYHGVGPQHLQSYLDEYVFRYNNRGLNGRGVFDAFLSRLLSAAAPVS